MKVEIPNYGEVQIDSVIFDLNGTLGESGRVDEEVKHLLERLADKYTVVVISSDTFGTLEEELGGLPVRIARASNASEKVEIARGYAPYAAVGNGNNDVAMLEERSLLSASLGRKGLPLMPSWRATSLSPT